jgi:hypothetical protein
MAQNGPPAEPGTYQLMTTEPKRREVFTTDLLNTIGALREQHRSVIVRVGEVTWAWIPSADIIATSGFVPFPEKIDHVAQEDLDALIERTK